LAGRYRARSIFARWLNGEHVMSNSPISNTITQEAPHPVAGAPAIPGLIFRRFRGESDFPLMAAILEASAEADHLERADSVDDIATFYAHLSNSDPYRDMVFAEVGGQTIAYSRCWWQDELDGPYVYGFVGYVLPAWRRMGIGRSILRWMEARLRSVAREHAPERPKFFQVFADLDVTGLVALLESEGYAPIRYSQQMVRPTMDAIPDFPLPEGLEVRSALPEHYRAIWEADAEAFRDHWGYTPPTEEDYRGWLENKSYFQPELWQIAWDVATNEVAGQVKTYIHAAENEKYNRKRGYTEGISVRRPYRRRGLARALIVRSLRAQREMGMTESALGVDSENISGATRVYEECGFRPVKRYGIYRKPL
jgi:GNAT superfamily N-acetyltransferase